MSKNVTQHQTTPVGHCRAQRFALDYHFDDQYEKEKAAIKSYEEGWDDWDGPIWPWRQTNHPDCDDERFEETYDGCCSSPLQDEELISRVSSTKNEELPVSFSPPRTPKGSQTMCPGLWNRCCSKCGHAGSISHL